MEISLDYQTIRFNAGYSQVGHMFMIHWVYSWHQSAVTFCMTFTYKHRKTYRTPEVRNLLPEVTYIKAETVAIFVLYTAYSPLPTC